MSTETTWEGFTPDITPGHEPFWASVREHRIALQRCDRCGTFRFIPSPLCPRCWSQEATWTPVSGRGEVYTYTVVHRAPTPAYQAMAPYVIAHVTLEEGPRMISQLVDVPPEEVRIGLPVELTYRDVSPELSLYFFTPRRP